MIGFRRFCLDRRAERVERRDVLPCPDLRAAHLEFRFH
jgi:hypothetical protein